MDRALELGINFFDRHTSTAAKKAERLTEHIIGCRFAQGGGRREPIVLATEVEDRMGDWSNQSQLSALPIVRACEDRFRRLRTDRTDLYRMHRAPRETSLGRNLAGDGTACPRRQGPWTSGAATSPAGTSCRPRKEPGAAGVSAWFPSRVSTTGTSGRSNWRLPASVALWYRSHTLKPAGGWPRGEVAEIAPGRTARRREGEKARIDTARDVRPRRDSVPTLASNQPMSRSPAAAPEGGDGPRIGPRTLDQLNGSMRALDIGLSTEPLDSLGEIFPSPGGPTPEAYAW